MLCQVTQKQASWVWTALRTARLHESKIGEESITDFLVLQLKKAAKGAYYIESFTRPKEKVTGADWELWFTGSSGKWLGLRVQAKVISIDGTRYAQLHYKRKDGTFQVDQLVSDAKKHGAVPLYCLYSYWKAPEAGKLTWPCGTFKKSSRLFGASWMSVNDVQALKPTGLDSLKLVAKSLHPFHCLFCCQGYANGDLPTRASAFLNMSGYSTEESSQLVDEPPYYVAQMLRSQAVREDLIDMPDQNLYRVTVLREADSEESNLSVDSAAAR
ncbi:MAG: hypothetical protein HY661_18935 [Betaproteobacteria bacterium]|nr:hypothetical protein [Betaproteobacteria bacterium]